MTPLNSLATQHVDTFQSLARWPPTSSHGAAPLSQAARGPAPQASFGAPPFSHRGARTTAILRTAYVRPALFRWTFGSTGLRSTLLGSTPRAPLIRPTRIGSTCLGRALTTAMLGACRTPDLGTPCAGGATANTASVSAVQRSSRQCAVPAARLLGETGQRCRCQGGLPQVFHHLNAELGHLLPEEPDQGEDGMPASLR